MDARINALFDALEEKEKTLNDTLAELKENSQKQLDFIIDDHSVQKRIATALELIANALIYAPGGSGEKEAKRSFDEMKGCELDWNALSCRACKQIIQK